MRNQIASFVKEDLLKGRAVYIRGNYLYFDGIKIAKDRLWLLNNGKEVVTCLYDANANLNKGDTITILNLFDTKAKVKIT